MPYEHVNITLPNQLKVVLDKEAELEKIKRSTLIQRALEFYLQFKRRKLLNQLLKEGYKEMASEAKLLSKEFSSIDREALKYVD